MVALPAVGDQDGESIEGPAFSKFHLTLQSGWREEIAGPLFYSEETADEKGFGFPPVYSHTLTPGVEWDEWDMLYPIVDYRRFGSEYRLQICQLFSFSGGKTDQDIGVRKFTIFPIYFQQRSSDSNLNCTALVPFYGHIENHLFKDDIKFIAFPLYSETRKKDVITDNYLFPIFDRRRGDHLSGWQIWPVVGVEHKAPTWRTNYVDEKEIVGGYDNFFAMWPFYVTSRSGLGTTNPASSFTLMPFYSRTRSPTRDETSYGWPLGTVFVDDRQQGYTERDALWPFYVHARGTKTVDRYFPFYSRATNAALESVFYAWPIYKVNRLHSAPLERKRLRIIFFLYSDTVEKNTQSGEFKRRVDFWPFYTYQRDLDGNRRLQALALMEPFFPNNRTVPREYSPVWSLWRAERNAKTGERSQSLLWNLYRHETKPGAKKTSLLFGLVQYQSTAQGGSWRIFYCHFGKKPAPPRPKS